MYTLRITLMDKNVRRADKLIGDVKVSLKIGSSGHIKIEIPSRCVSMARPRLSFFYEVLPLMYYEETEWVRQISEAGTVEADDEEA